MFIKLFSSERSTLGKLSLTTSWSAQHSRAGFTGHCGLSMGKHGGNVQTTWTLNIQEVGSWRLHQGL